MEATKKFKLASGEPRTLLTNGLPIPETLPPQQTNHNPKDLPKDADSVKYRKSGKFTWVDDSLQDWPEDDYRAYISNLSNEVNDSVLSNAFAKYKSLHKARVITHKITGKSKGFGFLSFLNERDYVKAVSSMNGKYIGRKPVKITKSNWKKRAAHKTTN